MKINIGKYVNWFGPYQLAQAIFFWKDEDSDFVHNFGTYLSETWISGFLTWNYNRQKRKIKIRVDGYDVWSMYHTLALIIHPMLLRLKEDKRGAPYIDNEDVPEHLRSKTDLKAAGDIDDLFFDRWDYVLDEIIWAFEQYVNDVDVSSDQFWGKNEFGKTKFKEEEYDAFSARQKNGLRLFGKYYNCLWN